MKIIIPALYIIIFSEVIGYCFNSIFKNKICKNILVGFCLMSITIYILYYYFYISINFIFIILILIFSLCLLYIFLKRKFDEIILSAKESLIIIIPLLVLFLIIRITYNDNFFIFRGNVWDNFFYLTQSFLLSEDTINNYEHEKNYETFQFILSRTMPSILVSFINVFSFTNVFESLLAIKLFALSLSGISIKYFFDKFNVSSEKFKIIASILFPLTFFNFYLYEIDALAQLIATPLIIVAITLTINLVDEIKNKNNIYIYTYILLISVIYIIYFEILFFYLLSFFIYCVFFEKLFSTNIKFLIKTILISVVLFLLLTRFFYSFDEMFYVLSRNAKGLWVDYWGYFGGFILGKESIILDRSITSSIQSNISDYLRLDQLIYILNLNYTAGYKFQLLNILPSLTGFFHLTLIKENDYLILQYLFIILLNLILAFIIFKNTKNLFLFNNKLKTFFLSNLIAFLIIFIFLIYIHNYWQIIKLFFFAGFLLFILLTLNFKNNKISLNSFSLLMIFIMALLPFYIYSIENNGNGRLSSFPSSLHPQLKNSFNWSFSESKEKNCTNIIYNEPRIRDHKNPKFHKQRMLRIYIADFNRQNKNEIICEAFIENGYKFKKIINN